MSTIKDKALLAISSKEAIRAAIIDKGINVDADVPLSMYANKLSLIKEVNIQVIASLTEPANPKPGMIWIKAAAAINNYIFASELNPDVVQDFNNNTVYIYSSTTSEGFEPKEVLLYDFGNGVDIRKLVACSVVIGNDLQLLNEVYVYNVSTLSFENVETLKLPLIFKDIIDLEQFLGGDLTPPSLFNVLGMAEDLQIMRGGEQIYP